MCADYNSCSLGSGAFASPAGLTGPLEEPLQVVPQRSIVRGPYMDVAVVLARLCQQAAQPDHVPCYGTPVTPGLSGLTHPDAAHDLWNRAENLRHAAGHFLITQNIPFRQPAHYGRAECIDHPADPRPPECSRSTSRMARYWCRACNDEAALGQSSSAPGIER